jgi:hypothetical protein
MSTQYNRSMVAGERLPFEIDVSGRSASPWSASSLYEAGTTISPTAANENGFIYQNTAEGQSNVSEPSWIASAGSTTNDGSLVWTALVPPNNEDTISSATYVQLNPPDGALIISGQSIGDLIASVFFGGGTSGQTYTINAVVTMVSGAVYIAQIVLAVQ